MPALSIPQPSLSDSLVTSALVFASYRFYTWFADRKIYGRPHFAPALGPMTLPGLLFGHAMSFSWKSRPSTMYREAGTELMAVIPWLWGRGMYWTNSPEVQRQIAGGGAVGEIWFKPAWSIDSLLYWGPSLLSESLENWRTHRRIMGPGFTKQTFEYVWRESSRLYDEMLVVESWPTKPGQITLQTPVQEVVTSLTLGVISSCGLGLPYAYGEPPIVPGHGITPQAALHVVKDWQVFMTFSPKWVQNLPIAKLRKVKAAFESMWTWLRQQVDDKREVVRSQSGIGSNGSSGTKDVFGRLIEANENEGKYALNQSELIGNTIVLVQAGHESTAGAISSALSMLAVYPAEQEEIYREIQQAIADDGDPSYAQHHKLERTMAAFLEGARMYPPAHVLIRQNMADTIITVPSIDPSQPSRQVHLPKGTDIVVDQVALEYNPRIYEDAREFKPSRWKNVAEDQQTMFSAGPRVCIGKKFALSSGTCFLAHFLRDWRVEPLLKEGETLDEWKQRTLEQAHIQIVLRMADAPLRFIRR